MNESKFEAMINETELNKFVRAAREKREKSKTKGRHGNKLSELEYLVAKKPVHRQLGYTIISLVK